MQSKKAGSANDTSRGVKNLSPLRSAFRLAVPVARYPASVRIVSWLLYDFGMAWFSMVVLTAYFILYFKEVIVGEKGYADFLWGVAISTAMAVSVLLSPLLGAAADASGNKKSFMAAFAGISILSVFCLYFTGPGQKAWAVFLVSAGYVGYTLAMTFYNAFLPEIAASGFHREVIGNRLGAGLYRRACGPGLHGLHGPERSRGQIDPSAGRGGLRDFRAALFHRFQRLAETQRDIDRRL